VNDSAMANILVADDEEALRSLLDRLLRSKGHQVYTAADGLEALRVGREHLNTLDLFVADIRMPGLDGMEVARLLKGSRSDLKVLFISGYTDERRLREPFLLKPFAPSTLLAKVHALLQPPGSTEPDSQTRGR
jgi:CheY-like chemotaxis protein